MSLQRRQVFENLDDIQGEQTLKSEKHAISWSLDSLNFTKKIRNIFFFQFLDA